MLRALLWCMTVSLVAAAALAKEAADQDDKKMDGISIVGNDDAPKSLVIVPWKSSDLGDGLDVSRVLDDGRQPVDRDVFTRELDYYQIRAESLDAKSGAAQ